MAIFHCLFRYLLTVKSSLSCLLQDCINCKKWLSFLARSIFISLKEQIFQKRNWLLNKSLWVQCTVPPQEILYNQVKRKSSISMQFKIIWLDLNLATGIRSSSWGGGKKEKHFTHTSMSPLLLRSGSLQDTLMYLPKCACNRCKMAKIDSFDEKTFSGKCILAKKTTIFQR